MKRCLPNPTGTSRRRPAWAALLTAAALALLAGCTPAPTADAVPVPPATAETAESAQSAQSTVSGNAATAESGAPAPTLAAALDGCLAYETGSAGGSLKAALAAADLVTYLAGEDGGPDAVYSETVLWRDSLSEAERATLDENWPGVYACAQSICEDPAAQQGLLDDAGVTQDFGAMDLSGVEEKLDAADRAIHYR